MIAGLIIGVFTGGIFGVLVMALVKTGATKSMRVTCKECKHRYTKNCALWFGSMCEKEYYLCRGDDFFCAGGEWEKE